ncbi:MAG: bifunctional 5,10-methylenetetrahydrofolate dehydrogenase/5,10-methenyltetrahydrofolate cyclohydrolase [bacterium]|nr:bifunctional 5,10-methylenetetrahydrofolate dehydrogenase/5,10-methenyltetrahydrofolate cyclohydrolase [bacterium]MDO8742771.1 bifunctional 5,10-methylenetetrahydrofolate dehydrogenase/5,10-methenyltetrahydrofolate cyclohydrolase [bacterium]
MIIDGRALAKDVLTRTKARAEKLSNAPHVAGIVASETSATRSYLRIKGQRAVDAGCIFEEQRFAEDVSTDSLREAIQVSQAGAIIVQLPLPTALDAREVCNAIPVLKDADVLSEVAREKFERGDTDALLPPVVGAVREIFLQAHVEMQGKRAVVIGNGWLVGNPCAVWLRQQGAEVTVVTLESGDIQSALADADIIVSGAGSPYLIRPEFLKQGVVLVDAGTSDSNDIVVGDADPACAEKCSVFTPVPGGVGPLAVAKLFENVVTLSERTTNR